MENMYISLSLSLVKITYSASLVACLIQSRVGSWMKACRADISISCLSRMRSSTQIIVSRGKEDSCSHIRKKLVIRRFNYLEIFVSPNKYATCSVIPTCDHNFCLCHFNGYRDLILFFSTRLLQILCKSK